MAWGGKRRNHIGLTNGESQMETSLVEDRTPPVPFPWPRNTKTMNYN